MRTNQSPLPLGRGWGWVVALLFITSCADDKFQNFAADRPAQTAEYAYLNDYQPLKNYVDRSAYPNFKLGVGTTASDYVKQELVYAVTNSNFDETVAGNAMKMGSCVGDDGTMDFATVSDFVTTATNAGLQVYGHTLAWHSQQPVKWLNSLIADIPVPVDPNATKETPVVENDFTTATSYTAGWGSDAAMERMSFDGALTMTSTEPTANFWDVQYMVASGFALDEGGKYVLRLEIKGSPAFDNVHYKVGTWSDSAKEGVLDFTGDWETREVEFTSAQALSGVFVLLQSGDYVGTYSIRKAAVYKIEAAGPVTFMESLIDNGDMEGDDAKNFAKKENAGDIVYEITDGVGRDGSRGVRIASKGGQADAWESQFWIVSNQLLQAGDKLHVSFDYRADGGCVGTSVDTQAHMNPGEYQHWQMVGSPAFTADWQTYDKTVTVDDSQAPAGKGMLSIAFNMSPNKTDGNYYIDNVVLEIEKASESGGIPQSEEQKKDTLTWAMEQWIQGMMEACEGNVKAWDVVNEAISGGNADSEGVYALQHDNQSGDFFWQDYLGDIDYVRTAVRLARQYGPEDVKLFINDYNLESDWDQNRKLTSLIRWIERWEADGVTRIDGIGSQMHISCYANPQTQESKKQAITRMLQLMAQTGKLVRISELDMGYVDADGNSVSTADMTEEQHHQMAEHYKWIVQQYLQIVPAQQQWGICQWCATDAATSDGTWRKGEPTGLWNQDYYRKHTYAGFADGLAGK